MRGTRRLALARETLTDLTPSDLDAIAGGATEPTAERCRTLLSLDDVCGPTLTIAALMCLRTIRDSSCACAGV